MEKTASGLNASSNLAISRALFRSWATRRTTSYFANGRPRSTDANSRSGGSPKVLSSRPLPVTNELQWAWNTWWPRPARARASCAGNA